VIDVRAAIGVAGTVTSAATIALGEACSVHRHRLSLASIESTLGLLASLELAERVRVPGLVPARAPVIVAGVVVLREILRQYALSEIEVSERDLLHGIALAAADLPEPEEGAVPPMAFTCC
jgi:exopolyphosphatase/guanosine-5'-triphosphate,3'-diphosphate pyrophosphatase